MSFSLDEENESLGLMGIEVLHLLESLQVQKRWILASLGTRKGFLSVFMACEILDHTKCRL